MNIVILGSSALATAQRLKTLYPQALIHGLRGRVEAAERHYDDFGDSLRALYRAGQPLLAEKGSEPPVLALAEDGSAVVPLLGGLAGVNRLAREIAAHLEVTPAITTSGELRFGTCLLEPPAGYALADLQQGKRFVSDLLGGETVRIEGQAPWLEAAQLPVDNAAKRVIHITPQARPAQPDELLIHPRSVAVLVERTDDQLAARIHRALSAANLAPQALAALLADKARMADAALHAAARELNLPLRFIHGASAELPARQLAGDGLRLLLAEQPLDVERLGQRRGRLSVVGLGPGAAEHMTPAVRRALDEAEDLLGYDTYVKMAGPLRADQCLHPSDNREELQRAAHAFELAATGRRVVMISSGDPGVFAMAAAVMEALESPQSEAWRGVELEVLPGVSAALATAAKAGAPLGHDFCLISLSDNLKPWAVIEQRLQHAAAADLAMAFYNPISRARPWQLGRALELLRQHRAAETLVVLGRDIGRPAEALRSLTLGELTPEMVDMRTLVIIGSSQTRRFPRAEGGDWVYTPRWYPDL